MRLLLLTILLALQSATVGANNIQSASNSAPETPSLQGVPTRPANHLTNAQLVTNAAERALWSFDTPAVKQILTDGVARLDFLAIEAHESNGKTSFSAWRDGDNNVQFAERKALPDEIGQQAGEKISRPLMTNGKEFGRLVFHLKQNSASLHLTNAERTYLTTKSVIRMCTLPDWLPYFGIDDKGEVTGIGADLVALMQERLGVKFELYPTKEWGESLKAIRERSCDILPLASDLPDRHDAMDFTRSYLTTPLIIATRNSELFIRDGSEIGDRKIGIVKDYSFAALLKQRYPGVQIVDVSNIRDGLSRVSKGEIWGYLDGMDSIAYALQKHSMHDLKITGKLEFNLELSAASRNDERLLSSIMQKATDSISEEERRAIINKWIAVRFEQGLDRELFWKWGVGAVLLLLAAVAWNRRLAKFNKQLGDAQSTLQQKTTELQAALQELDVIFRNVGIGIGYARDRHFVRVNSALAKMTGYSEAELIGKTGQLYLSEEAYEAVGRGYALMSAGQSFKIEVPMLRADGTSFLCVHTGALLDPSDPSRASIWTYQDVTEQRAAEDRLTQAMGELDIIFQNASIGIVYLVDRRFMRLNKTFETISGYSAAELLGESTRKVYVSDEVYKSFEPVYAALANGQPVARVDAALYKSDGSEVICELTGSLVDPYNPAKGSIWLYQDITDEREAEEKLARTLNELEIIFQNASIGIAYIQDRRIVRVNAAFAEMFGYEGSALIGQSTRIYYPSDQAYAALAGAHAALAAGQAVFKCEVTMLRANGDKLLCSHTGSLVDHRDPAKGSIWLYQDITEQRAAEQKLAQTLSELDIIFQNARIGISYIKNRCLVRVNKALADMLGYAEDALIGQSTRIYFPSDEAYLVAGRGYPAMAEGKPFRMEVLMRKADGSDLLCAVSGSTVDLGEAEKGSIWTYQDITTERAAEDKLAQTLKEMEIIYQNASIGIIYTHNRVINRANAAITRMYGRQESELIGQGSRILYSSDEAWESMAEAYAALANGQSYFKSEVLMRRADGTDFVCALIGSLVDPDDPENGSIWLHQDITEQRVAEDKLTQTLNELDIIFNNASVGIVFNVNRRFVRINKTFESMFGWPVAELIGQETRRFYKSDEAWAAIGKAVNELPTNERLRVDMEMVRVDGSEILCEGICSYVDPSDRSKGVVWLFTDITELRRAQAALQRARDDALAKNALIEQQHALVTHTLDQVATLLNNSGQGFLSFGRDLMIEEGFSQECQRIFGRDVLDLPLPELLFAEDARQRSFLEKTLRLVMDSTDDHLRRDAYLGLLPAEYRLGERYCKAEYRLLDNVRMMLILTDITDEKRLTERLAQERLRVEFVVHALESRDELLEMLRDFETFRSRGLPDLLSFERHPQTLLAEVFRHIHTFKSLFAQASLPTIPDVMHDLENRLGRLRDLGAALDTNAIKRELGSTDLGAALAADLALLREKLGDDFFNSEREIRVPASKLASLEAEASTLYGSDSRMLGLIRYLRYVPLQFLIEPHFKAAEQLAERQEKLLAPITCSGKSAPVDPEVYGPFCKSLVHLFRNSVDHGIEDADTRLMAEKDETGTIRCEVRTEGGHLILTIADDGCGIDVAQIRAKAIEQEKLSAAESASMSDAEALMLVFADGITTSEEVSTISGRGVGLGAVQQELLALGGTVRVESIVGQGTCFSFTLPYALPVVAKAPSTSYATARKFLAPLPEIAKTFCDTHLKLAVTVDETLHEFTVDKLFDFTALLSLGDRLNASIGVSIERPLLLEMTRRFEPDFPEEEIEELAESVGAEITNTLVGNATVYFTHLARHVAMGTPEIVSPEGRTAKIGTRAFRGFTGRAEAGAFMIFCLLTEENPV